MNNQKAKETVSIHCWHCDREGYTIPMEKISEDEKVCPRCGAKWVKGKKTDTGIKEKFYKCYYFDERGKPEKKLNVLANNLPTAFSICMRDLYVDWMSEDLLVGPYSVSTNKGMYPCYKVIELH